MSVYANIKIDERGWKAVRQAVKNLDKAHVKVGVLGSKGGNEKHPTEDGKSDFTMVDLAAVHEFGSEDGHTPERAPIRIAFETSEDRLAAFVAPLSKAVIMDKMTVHKALSLLGLWGQTEVRNTITQSDLPPPLADSTIAAKGSDRPLVDTGRYVQSIAFEVSTDAAQ